MTRILILALLAASAPIGIAQGTIYFSNSGGGVDAPFTIEDVLVGARHGITAQLQLADGTNIGEPAAIRARGIFSGGIRIIDGKPSGSRVVLGVALIDDEGQRVARSNLISVSLGGGSSEEPPARLIGLQSIRIESSRRQYYWLVGECYENVEVGLKTVDPCLCKDEPLPPGWTSVPACKYDIGPSGIAFWITEDGFMEFRWREGWLYMSSELDRSKGKPVSTSRFSTDLGYFRFRMDNTGEKMFYWLEDR